jgi:N utilization substance protein B
MKRRVAREIAVQSLYQMEMNQTSAEQAIASIFAEAGSESEVFSDAVDERLYLPYVRTLVNGTYREKKQIDLLLEHYLQGWKMDRLSRVDKQILRLAVYEMVFEDEVPPKAVINEAIELSKHFGTEESGKFVNGVLGKMIKELDEIKTRMHV